jgi:hypothetical protein
MKIRLCWVHQRISGHFKPPEKHDLVGGVTVIGKIGERYTQKNTIPIVE